MAETLTIRVVSSVRTLDKEERSVCSPSEIAQLYATLQHCVVAGSDHWSGIQFRRGLRPDLIHHVGYGLRSTYLPRIPVNKGWGCASTWSPKVSSANFAVKLSEKPTKRAERGPSGGQSGPIRLALAPLCRPNHRSERCSHPFSDSFLTEFPEVRCKDSKNTPLW